MEETAIQIRRLSALLEISQALGSTFDYKVAFENSDSGNIVAMNYNRSESDLNFADAEQFKAQNPNLSVINVSGMESAAIAKEVGRGTALWKYCLVLVLLFLAFETGLLLWWK